MDLKALHCSELPFRTLYIFKCVLFRLKPVKNPIFYPTI